MQIEKLLEEQEKEFEKSELCKRITTTEMYAINHGFPEWKGETVMDWHKQSLKQFIDGLVEREDGEIREFKVTGDGEYHFGENQKVIGWNMAKEYTISHLKELIKQLE